MIRAGVDRAERITTVRKIVVDLLDNRSFRVMEVDEHQTANARRHLIHQTGRLAVVHVLGVLPDLRDLNRRHGVVREQSVQNTANENFERRRAGEAGTRQHRGLHLCVKA